MAIDFTLSNEQRELQASARHFAENVLAPVVRAADDEPDPLRAFQMTKDAYVAAYNSSALLVYDRDSAGRLTQKAGAAGCISDGRGGGLR